MHLFLKCCSHFSLWLLEVNLVFTMLHYLNSRFLVALIGVTVLDLAVYAIYYFHKIQEKRRKKEINEVVIFHSGFIDCKRYCPPGSKNALECSKKSVQKLMNYVESSKTSIDICLYFFTCQELADAVIKCLRKRQVIVRVIVDCANELIASSQLSDLLHYGVHLRYKKSTYIMHHKYIVIDRKILIAGSCNWTNNALYANLENVIILSKENIVRKFIEHFDDLWEQFS